MSYRCFEKPEEFFDRLEHRPTFKLRDLLREHCEIKPFLKTLENAILFSFLCYEPKLLLQIEFLNNSCTDGGFKLEFLELQDTLLEFYLLSPDNLKLSERS